MNGSRCRRRRAKAAAHAIALLLLAIATGAVCACRRSADPAQGISVEESIAPQPVRSGDETVTLRLADAARHPVAEAHVQIEADMNHPGMAPLFSNAVETTPGSYRTPLTFTMGGDWVVLAHITLADGRRIERQWDVKGVESR
ncbi:MAG TPA: FixH family protein [Terracidiphilus sp.]|jgi:hypothetical protein|nr:FixH family protein [Terracidiphilus sp.]